MFQYIFFFIILTLICVMLFVYITLVISSWVCRGVSTYNENDNGNNNISIDESLSLSTTMTNLVEQHGFREEVIDVSGVGVHVVIKDPSNVTSDVSKDIFVFIHGTASASVTFFNIMDQIPPNVKCVAIDLPSFGISDTIDVEIYPSNEDMCIGYANIIGETLHKLSILDNTVLVGHSLGGFLSIYVAARYPIKKLVLLNPAGILPTLGVWGYYWAIFFKAGLPTSIFDLPLISRVGMKRIINMIFHDDSLLTHFWLSIYSNSRNKGRQILQRVITLTRSHSYWNTPAFSTLIDVYKKIPTTVCFGVKDTICPSHIGYLLKYVSQGQIMIHNIYDANHNPCVNTAKMADVLNTIFVDKDERIRNITLKKSINTKNKKCCKGYSYPSLSRTQESIQQFYKYILTHTR